MTFERTLVVAVTPSICQKGLVWFQKHERRIEKASSPFWQRNTLILHKDQKIMLSELTRKLSDLGYRKYRNVQFPGEFSQAGGIITLFPINLQNALKLEFFGNIIESIRETEIQNNDLEKPLNEIVFPEGKRRKETEHDLSGLKEGDYIVHLDHGIGLYKTKFQSYYILEYAGGDKLQVPEEVSHKLSPYIGFSSPTIYRLGGNLWHKTKKKVNDDIIKTAKELLKIYAEREIANRPPYASDAQLEAEIESGFEFSETEDQLSALRDIMSDMDKQTPMDRLVCGDVGFGKTEVALRAAARAIFSGRQVAIIAPTTVLAWQHYQTFKNRLEKFPISVGMLTRIQNKNEQSSTLSKLNEGKMDLLVGTHRILQNDVIFRNLGLLIIDEEQRFGVKQKEKLKNMRAELDILSLSATPIPRTLYFSMSGLKDISTIESPPSGRLAIETFILPRSGKTISSAIQKEIERGGQVYYLHNRVSTIESVRERVQKLAGKDVKVLVGHAQLPDNRLIEIIEDFKNKKADVLIATTIIENGLDLSNVNTLIVDDATKLGLSQSHQLRGRVGRGDKQAYAFFLYPKKELSDIAEKRLETLQKYQGLGDGYQIALRDLEIRGAGNILGRDQHGTINKVGLNLYVQMLNESVEKLRQGTN